MYIEKEDNTKCRCGLTIFDIDFIEDTCAECYEDEYSIECTSCGHIDSHEFFTNFLCINCSFEYGE